MFFKFTTSTFLYILAGLVLCLFVTFPYLKPGFFPTHDGEWAVVRAAEMFREIRDLQFPPRYSGALNFGYGYPLFNFAYPFPYYVTTVFHALNLGFIESVKAVFALSVFVSFFGMFVLSAYFWRSKFAGFISAVLYIYLPYRMVDLYVRGSIGESVAFALYPLILFSMLLIVNPSRRHIGIFCTALLIGILALTHNIAAVYFGIIAVFFVTALLLAKKYKEALYVALAGVWGGVLSSFFVFPALYEKQNIKLSKIPIADRNLYFVDVFKIFIPSWGYGTPTDANPFTYNLGIPQFLGFVLSVFSIPKTKDFTRTLFVSFVILTVLFILMMFPAFSFVWRLPLLSEINYPWTLLLPLGFLMSFLSGVVIKIKFGKILGVILVISAMLLTFSYANPESYVDRGDDYYITNEATTTSSQELMPLWVSELPTIRYENKINPGFEVSNLLYSSNKITFIAASSSAGILSVNQIYYPGWLVTVNNKPAEIQFNNPQGIMSVNIPAGENLVELKFSETKLRGFFDIVSLTAFVVLIGYGVTTFSKHAVKRRSPKTKRK